MTTWIFSSNPDYYKAKKAFKKLKEIDWGTNSGVIGDTVYLYESQGKNNPEGKIILKTEVTKVNISENEFIDDREFWGEKEFNYNNKKRWVRLKLVDDIFSDEISNNLSYSKLKGNGLNASILGPIILDNNTELKKYVENVLSTNSDKPIVKFKNMQINVLKLEENFDKFKIFIKNVLGWAKDTVQGINISHQKRLRRF